MSFRLLDPSDSLGAARGQPVVCIPVYEAYDVFASCLRRVLEHTPVDVPILVADDASADENIGRLATELGESAAHDVVYARQPRNLGFVENVNAAFAMIAPGDVVLLNSDCLVAEGWVQALRDAAYSDSIVATASALTNHGTILSVPDRNEPRSGLPAGVGLDEAAAALRDRSLKLRPRIPTALGHCVYVRRTALDLVGRFDPAFSPGYGEEVDFSQRCILRGLSHVVADDVLVLHEAASSFGEQRDSIRRRHDDLVLTRYPFYAKAVEDAAAATTGPLPRALAVARRTMQGLSLTIDGRVLGPYVTGTQRHVLELVAALWRTGDVRIRLILPRTAGDETRSLLAELDGIELVAPDEIRNYFRATDVVHRPFQAFELDDLASLPQLGERVVLTQQDLIAYRNPGYFADFEAWRQYQRVTRMSLALADRVVFFSEHAARDALAEDLVEEGQFRVVYVGTDHRLVAASEPARPAALDGERRFLLCLGTDFRHKNRLFALQLLEELRRRHSWDGLLVFAGPHAAGGTSADDEREFIASRPELAEASIDLGSVPEAEKAWLLANTELVLFPTTYEGFGLIPFEAAEAGTACMFAPQTSLAEILPVDAATIVPWDAAATADRAIELVEQPERRGALVEAIRAASRRFTWDATAKSLIETYVEAVEAPARPARAIWVGGEAASRVVAPSGFQRAFGTYPVEAQRALVGLASRRGVRTALFAGLRAFYSLFYLARHRRVPPRL